MKAARVRDRACGYPGCAALIRRTSTYCRHHLGVLHGAASARSYGCSSECQGVHRRCPRCGTLCGGGHARELREGLCYEAGQPSCWHQVLSAAAPSLGWLVSCLACTRAMAWAPRLRPGLRCAHCGSSMLVAERALLGRVSRSA